MSASIAYDRIADARIRFPFLPKLVVVENNGLVSAEDREKGCGFVVLSGQDTYYGGIGSNSSYNETITFEWQGNTINWYSAYSVKRQCNTAGTTYRYLAIG